VCQSCTHGADGKVFRGKAENADNHLAYVNQLEDFEGIRCFQKLASPLWHTLCGQRNKVWKYEDAHIPHSCRVARCIWLVLQTFNQRITMLLAVLILIAAGVYVCVKREVQASAKFVIRGRAALRIGITLILGGVLAVALPAILGAAGVLRGFVARLILSIATMFGSLVCMAIMIIAEKRRQEAEAGSQPVAGHDGTVR
jgi:hypothetical protein